MEPKRIGERIAFARKELQYTQRELAEKLQVSDKAVSRWERGVGCPDISLLLPLCEELHMDVSTLLGKEEESKGQNEAEKEAQKLRQFADYAKWMVKEKKETIAKWIGLFLSIASWLAIGICLLVEYVMTQSINWSLTASAGIFYGWSICIAFLMTKEYRLEKMMGIASVLLFPLLYIISLQVELSAFFPTAYYIAIGAIVLSWLLYAILLRLHFNIWYRLALCVTLSLVFNIWVNVYTLDWNIATIILQLGGNVVIIVALVGIGIMRRKLS